MIDEEQRPKPRAESSPSTLSDRKRLVEVIEDDPHSDSLWTNVVNLARAEKGAKGENFYAHVPLEELIAVGEKLRSASTMEDKYRILAGKCTTGELWYDIILGHINDKNLKPLVEAVSIREYWNQGLDLGSGPGNSLRAIAPYCSTIIGLDKLDFLLEVSRNNSQFPKNARLAVGDVTELRQKFKSDSFDLVVSNGLTHYLAKEEMQKLISGLTRVMRRHGSYFEPFVIKEEGELLPAIEKEYLASAKGVLVCLLDRLVSHADKPPGMDFKTMVRRFKMYGFEAVHHRPNEEGIFVMQFRKMRRTPVR